MLKKVFSFFTKKKSLLFLLSLILIFVFVFTLTNSFAADVEVKNITYQSTKLSSEDDDPGSWNIDVNAEWVSKGRVRVTFKLDSVAMAKDIKPIDLVLLVDDTIDITTMKNRIRAFGRSFLSKNSDNSLAVIKFNSVAEIASDFGTDLTELNSTSYGNLDGSTGLSYYSALDALNELLETSTDYGDNDIWVVLITDGDPARDMGKEKETYNNIRKNYPEIKNFFAVQYNVGGNKSDILKEMSDVQYVGTDLSSFYRIISNIDYMVRYVDYDLFSIDTLINTDVFSIDNIKPNVTFGTSGNIIGARMIWFFGNEGSDNRLATGFPVTMSFDLKLKDKYSEGAVGVYPLFRKVAINYKIGDVSETIISTDTPALANAYPVVYDGNAPSDCTINHLPYTIYHNPFSVVDISSTVPVCAGYEFKGWQIDDTNVERKGTNFVMPPYAVTLKATWAKASMNKTVDGTIYEAATLYDIVAGKATLDTNLDLTSTTTTNKGVYTYSSTANDNYPIHYYHGSIDDNNLLFAGFCWKIVRTTDTGGVKILYNGLPNSNNQCTNTACSIGKGAFNTDPGSIASVGYMYGSLEKVKTYTMPKWYDVLGLTTSTINISKTQTMGTGKYYFTSSYSSLQRNNFDGTYVLNNATQDTWSTSYKKYYTCLDGSSSCSEPVYIVGGTSTEAYYVPIYMNASTSATYSSGNYKVASYIGQKIVWAEKYETLADYYVCPDSSDVSCSNIYYVISYNEGNLTYVSLNDGSLASDLKTQAANKKIIFGNWEQWDGTQYVLQDTISLSVTNLYNEFETLTKGYNYTCFSENTKCASVKYLIYYKNETISYYDINAYNLQAFKEAKVFNNINDSNAKTTIETWYKNNMTSYTDYLEDATFCNNREIITTSLVSENTIIGKIAASSDVRFFGYDLFFNGASSLLKCNNSYDKFTTTNGLKYPVGLLTYDEVLLAGRYYSFSYLGTLNFWTMSPLSTTTDNSRIAVYGPNVNMNTFVRYCLTSFSNDFRPVVSIKPGMKVDYGDGTSTNPYVLILA